MDWPAGIPAATARPATAAGSPSCARRSISLADEIDAIYQYETRRLLADPWRLIYQYIDVVLGSAIDVDGQSASHDAGA